MPPLSLSKKSFGLFRQTFCSLRSIFRQVHALTENVLDFVFRLRGKFCEAFSTV